MSSDAQQGFASFREFYAFYLGEHPTRPAAACISLAPASRWASSCWR